MPWIAAALVVLLVQHFAGCAPSWPAAPRDDEPPAVATLLRSAGGGAEDGAGDGAEGGANSTADAVELVGRVTDAAPTYADGVRLTVDVESADGRAVTGLVSVSMRATSRRWRTGDRVAVRSRLRRVGGFGNFGELDWAAYNARRGVFVTAYAWDDEDVVALPAADGVVDGLRRRFSEACERVGAPGDPLHGWAGIRQGAEILEALVIGDRTGIDRPTSDAVRDAGLAHFLAISGSHMALLVAVVVGGVRAATRLTPALLERYDVLRAAAVLGAAAVLAYGAVSGGGVSVARSVMMAVAAMAALWRGRPGDDLRALGGSAVVIALAMPGVGGEAGFQLSFLAVAALVLDGRRRREARRLARAEAAASGRRDEATPPLPRWRRALEALLEAGRLTLVCWAVTSPVVAFHFQRISLVAPLANLLAAPLISFVVVCGIGALALLPAAPSLAAVALWAGALACDALVALSAWCASLPLASTTTPAPSPLLAGALTVAALALLAPAFPGRRALVAGGAALAACLVAVALHGRWREDRLDVWFASVGQGDAAVVRLPGGEVWVVDAGPPGRGRMVVGPLLRRAWIGRVDVLVGTHLQADHTGALAELLEEFDVGEVWLPAGPCDAPGLRVIEEAAARRGVPLRRVSVAGGEGGLAGEGGDGGGVQNRAGPVEAPADPRVQNRAHPEAEAADGGAQNRADPAAAAGASVELLLPLAADRACDDNDQSIVLAFAFAGRRVLMTGDVEAAAESSLVQRAVDRADVLKAPHHGSRTSSSAAFLDAVQPSLVVASVGLENRFHHPAPDIVARYDERGVCLRRTDRDGAVHLAVDDDGTMRVETFHDVANGARCAPRRFRIREKAEAAGRVRGSRRRGTRAAAGGRRRRRARCGGTHEARCPGRRTTPRRDRAG